MKKDDAVLTRPEYREVSKSEPSEQQYRFTNLQTPGGILKFNYGPTNCIETYILFPGGTYNLRREVYDHVMSRGKNQADWRPDGTGKMRATNVNLEPYFMLTPTRF